MNARIAVHMDMDKMIAQLEQGLITAQNYIRYCAARAKACAHLNEMERHVANGVEAREMEIRIYRELKELKATREALDSIEEDDYAGI